MLHQFLEANRKELIERCQAKLAGRPAPQAGTTDHGAPWFLGQLIEALRGEDEDADAKDRCRHAAIVAAFEFDLDAGKHGYELLRRGYTVEQVVHDYGDMYEAVAELAQEREAAISPREFKALTRCLDHAVAGAVAEYDRRRDQMMAQASDRVTTERLGFLAHELRNFLNTAVLAFAAVKSGSVGVDGPTARVIDRSLVGLRDLIDGALGDVRFAAGATQREPVALDAFIGEVAVGARLGARAKGCELSIAPVEPGIALRVDQRLLHGAVENLLQNAFKFTRPASRVALTARATPERVLIEVQDECGGLPAGKAESMFASFQQHHADRSGLGLGLSIARRAVENCGGNLGVRDLPGVGCVFTIELPR